ncbi:MAG: mechanosensitive ion channel [Legionellales bacterium]|nr:mechanosensitive ion channel [Legionellales bacterium]
MKSHSLKCIILFIVLNFSALGSYAEQSKKITRFDPIKANQFLDTLSIQLSIVTPSYEVLEDAIAKIITKKEQAERCITDSEYELREFERIKDSQVKEQRTKHDIYITEKRLELKNHLSECRLIVIRANEAITALSIKAKELEASRLLTAESSLLDNILHLKDLAVLIYKNFNYQQLYLQTGLNNLSLNKTLALFVFMFLGYLTGLRFRKIIRARITKIREQSETVPSILYQAILCVLEKHEIYLIQSCFIAAYFSLTSLGLSLVPLGVIVSFIVFCFIVYTSLIRFLFSPPPPGKSLINIAKEIEHPLINRLKTLGLVLCLAFIIGEALKGQPIPAQALQLPITIFITIVTINLMSVLWLVNRIKMIRAKFYTLRIFINTILTAILFGILITNWIGLSQLSIYLLSGIAFSLLSFTIFFITHKLLQHFLLKLSGTESKWQQVFRTKLGLKTNASIPELIWIRLVFYLVTWTCLVLLLLKIWRISAGDYQIFVNMLTDGFHIGQIEIVPIRIAFGLIISAIMMICTRLIKTNILIRETPKTTNKGTVVAFATMFGYFGFTISFFIGAIIAGINFAGLTIIFGALSVGIGFWLQNIVNNFVSGLILLIERPIKVGDRIIVSGIEGHVKDINIRSTTVRAIKQYDVIVPNSELISSSVNNLMFGDYIYRVSVYVLVPYGSDMKLVRKTLAKAAINHEDAISDTIEVLLIEFADSGIKLELRCILSNVDRHVQITSELHFMVEEELKAAGITIPFPQRDVHIDKIPDLPSPTPQQT